MDRRFDGFVLILAIASMVSLGAQRAPPPRASATRTYRVAAATSPIQVDGSLDEPAWAAVEPIALVYEWSPGDNAAPPVRTDAFLTFDAERVYLAFKAYDPEPEKIRAHLMDRDSIETFVQDDHVTFMIDPFDDRRRAFQFRVNPLGVQADAIFSEVEAVEDFSWDLIWQSAGRINAWGYAVEAAPGDGATDIASPPAPGTATSTACRPSRQPRALALAPAPRRGAGTLSTADLSELRVVYNFSTRSLVRALFQYLRLEQDPVLFDRPVERREETLFTQLLYSYKLNPQTVLFVGYSDDRRGLDGADPTLTDRTLFPKVGYAFLR